MKNRNVFINCPFSADYQEHFRAIVFTVIRSGFEPRCALETDDGSENRFNKICNIIRKCAFGIHDISKTDPDKDSGLPRFNMPLELGLFLAAKKFGASDQRRKKCIILDKNRYRYQQFMSDIAGQDIHSHSGKINELISEVASWLRDEAPGPRVPGGKAISTEYTLFLRDIPAICATKRLDPGELTFQDYRKLAEQWIVAANEA